MTEFQFYNWLDQGAKSKKEQMWIEKDGFKTLSQNNTFFSWFGKTILQYLVNHNQRAKSLLEASI